MNFKLWIEAKRPIVSYDFDGVLHTSMVPGTTDPLDFYDWKSWEPYTKMHNQLKKDALWADIVVISKRNPHNIPEMKKFIQTYHLPVKQIYGTNMQPKLKWLQDVGAVLHYDDNPEMYEELEGTDIDFVKVDQPNI